MCLNLQERNKRKLRKIDMMIYHNRFKEMGEGLKSGAWTNRTMAALDPDGQKRLLYQLSPIGMDCSHVGMIALPRNISDESVHQAYATCNLLSIVEDGMDNPYLVQNNGYVGSGLTVEKELLLKCFSGIIKVHALFSDSQAWDFVAIESVIKGMGLRAFKTTPKT